MVKSVRNIIIASAGLLVCLLSACTPRPAGLKTSTPRPKLSYNDEQRYKYFFYEAINQQEKENYDAAFDLYRHCLDINPNAAEVYYALTAYYAEMQDDSMALASVKKAAALDSGNDTYQERLAITYINSGLFNDATDCYEQLYSRNKNRSDVLGVLLQLYNQQKDFDKMIWTLNRMEEVEGSSEQTTLLKMRVYAMTGDKDRELKELQMLAEKHPNDLNYHVMMGNWLLQNSRADDALEEFEYVLNIEPENQGALTSMLDYYRAVGKDSLANALQEQLLVDVKTPVETKVSLMRQLVGENEANGGDSTQVIAVFKRILNEPQHESDMLELYAAYMQLKKMPQDSINQVWKEALVLTPDNAGVRLQLAQALWGDQRFDEVAKLCEEGTEYNPDEIGFYYFLGLSYLQKDDYEATLHAMRRGVGQIDEDSNPDIVSDFYAIMGDMLHRKGIDEEAFAAYDSCLQYKPDNYGCLNNYAYYLSLKETDLQKAEQMSYRTIKAEPTNATFLDTYAWILFQQERYTEAAIYMEQTLQNDSTPSVDVLEHAGDIYAKNEQMDKAVEFWQQAVDAGSDSKVLIRKIKLRKYIKP
ncbi:MAG: tetratricopeptide repeat protein [Prevotella sp.]|nr:tetratricopeptide repeat protein [Prevotella sp.]